MKQTISDEIAIYVRKWFQWGKKNEIMTITEMVDLLIKMEQQYEDNDIRWIKEENINHIMGIVLNQKLNYNKCYTIYKTSTEDQPTQRINCYYAKLQIPPWLKKELIYEI